MTMKPTPALESADDDILAPLVEKIRARVNRGELQEKYLAIAEYMTDPAAPFPIKDRDLPEFFEGLCEWTPQLSTQA